VIRELKTFGIEKPHLAVTMLNPLSGKDKFAEIIIMHPDQGQVTTKLLEFERGVALHGGMPVPIATPAHRSAFGRAGENRAVAMAILWAFPIVCHQSSVNGQHTK
jgi:4-hydroxythreonine-4-phosphate dehydrogenase